MNADQLAAVLPKTPRHWLEALCTLCEAKDVTDVNEQAMFVAQLAHESGSFTHLEENLSYSPERLMQVWPRRFPTIEAARPYSHNPTALGNLVYANRMGNGDVTSGDGFRYRGRGPIQLTGKTNYTAVGAETDPDLLLQPATGLLAAWWFWETKKCRGAAREGNVAWVTQAINGGLNGLEQRKALYSQVLAAIQ